MDNSEEAIICDGDTVDESKSLQPTFCDGSDFHETIIREATIERSIHDDLEPRELVVLHGISQRSADSSHGEEVEEGKVGEDEEDCFIRR